MQIKPDLVLDQKQGVCVGATENIDIDFVHKHPNPDPDYLKSIFVKEADCSCTTTLDGKLSLPVSVEYLAAGHSGNDTM